MKHLLKIVVSLHLIQSIFTLRWPFPSIQLIPAFCSMFPNEEYLDDIIDSEGFRRCQKTCADYAMPGCLSFNNEPDCFCKSGFARRTNQEWGECIPITSAECQSQFPVDEADCALLPNEELVVGVSYPRQIENTCQNHLLRPDGLTAATFWAPHCDCKLGFKRLPNGVCVAVDDPECYKLWKPSYGQCLLREETFAWGPTCQQTCATLGQPLACDSQVKVPDCYCHMRKVRISDNDKRCVFIEDCEIYLAPAAD
ncbi:hypothetical protein HA402_002750 [Bradysia odoriphaga]|nr:hypothetical protein HA402_002750 [Bradysia odoriphaga]